MEVKFAFLADSANLSSEGKLNVLGVFTEVYADKYPAVHGSIVLVVGCDILSSDAGHSRNLRARFVTQDGTELATMVMGLVIPPPPAPAARITQFFFFRIGSLVIPGAGTYEFVIDLDGHQELSVPFRAVNAPGEPHADDQQTAS